MLSYYSCPICKNSEVKCFYKNYPGFIEKTQYEIFRCEICNTNFIPVENIDSNVYEIIYSDKNTIGYDRYFSYANRIKEEENPLEYLSNSESTYFPAYKFLKNKKGLKILEVGCGYGYLSYALSKAGFDIKGIDISEKAIQFAKMNFGPNYFASDIKSYLGSSKEKYDLIVSTEVIEHLTDQNDFISDCLALLKSDGLILLTTPNKSYYRKKSIWQTDLPPVHTIWLSKESFQNLAVNLNLDCEFIDFSGYYPRFENRLVKYIRSRKERIPVSILTEDYRPNPVRYNVKFSVPHMVIWNILHKFPPVRFLSNFIYNLFLGDELTLGVILRKKQERRI